MCLAGCRAFPSWARSRWSSATRCSMRCWLKTAEEIAGPDGLLGQLTRRLLNRATLPVMKAGAVHTQRPAHHADRKVRLFRLSQREDLAYGSPVSRAKKAAAFLRISRSIRSV